MSNHDLKNLMQNLIASIFLIVLTSGSAVAASPEPCLKAQDNCAEWLTLDAKGSRGLVYRTQPLTSFNPSVQKAVVVVHGQGRNADGYFRHMLAAAFLADALRTPSSSRPASRLTMVSRALIDLRRMKWVGFVRVLTAGEAVAPALTALRQMSIHLTSWMPLWPNLQTKRPFQI